MPGRTSEAGCAWRLRRRRVSAARTKTRDPLPPRSVYLPSRSTLRERRHTRHPPQKRLRGLLTEFSLHSRAVLAFLAFPCARVLTSPTGTPRGVVLSSTMGKKRRRTPRAAPRRTAPRSRGSRPRPCFTPFHAPARLRRFELNPHTHE